MASGIATLAAVILAILALNLAGLRDRLFPQPPPKIQSIAVLPLENLSGDPEQEFFADGMTEALISDLGRISALRVISRTSAMHYKGTKKRLPEIARELNVEALVEGSVLRSSDRVRITTQLIQASPEKHLWTETYERDLRDVLLLQSEVAQAIAHEVQLRLTPQEQTRLASVRPVHPRAHEAYLRGRHLFGSYGSIAIIRNALAYFQEAIEIDRNHAEAYVGLAWCYKQLEQGGVMPPGETHRKAKEAVLKALEITPMLGDAHAMLGQMQYEFEWRWAEAEREFKLAIEYLPNSAFAHTSYAAYLRDMQRFDEGMLELERARELDPQSPAGLQQLWIHCWLRREYDEVIKLAQKHFELGPYTAYSHAAFGWPYVQKGMYEEAIREFEKATALDPGDLKLRACLGRVYAEAGLEHMAREILRDLEDRSKHDYAHPYHIAIIYIGLRDNDAALEWLEQAYKVRTSHMRWLRVDPWLDPLRSDPRFQELVRRMKFPD